MKRMGSLMIIIVMAVFLFGCSSATKQINESVAVYDTASPADGGFTSEVTNKQEESEQISESKQSSPEDRRKIIKNANVNLIADT